MDDMMTAIDRTFRANNSTAAAAQSEPPISNLVHSAPSQRNGNSPSVAPAKVAQTQDGLVNDEVEEESLDDESQISDESGCSDDAFDDEFDDGTDWSSPEQLKWTSQSTEQHMYQNVSEDRYNHYTPPSKIHSDLATIEFLAVNEALYLDLLMTRKEKFTKSNIGVYKKHVKWLLTYYEDWRFAQLELLKKGWSRKEIEKTGLAKETYRNLRRSVCGLLHAIESFLDYLPSRIDNMYYIPPQIGNQSPLEALYSWLRAHDLDTCDMGTGVTNKSVEGLATAQRNSSYDSADCIDMRNGKVSGSRMLTRYQKMLNKKVADWLSLHTSNNSSEPPSRFGEGDIHSSELFLII